MGGKIVENKFVKTHFGWRDGNLDDCYHCNTRPSLWSLVARMYDARRAFFLSSCEFCGGFHLEYANYRTGRYFVKEISKEEAERLLLALEV